VTVFTLEHGYSECGCGLDSIYANQTHAERAALQMMSDKEKPFAKEPDFADWRYTEDLRGCTKEIVRIWHTPNSYELVLIRKMEVLLAAAEQEEGR
jgi:hypothetical protein